MPELLGKMEQKTHEGKIEKETRLAVTGAETAGRKEIEQMGIDAGKYKRGGSGTSITTIFAKMTPEARMGAVQKALTTGIDPETGEPMTEMARSGYQSMYDQDARTVNAKNQKAVAGKVDPAVAGFPVQTAPSVTAGQAGLPAAKPKVYNKETKKWE